MKWLRSAFAKLRGLFRSEEMERDLDTELASHLEMHVADNLRAGMTAAEARRDALIKLGGVEQTKESYREQRDFVWIENLAQDARFGFRMLRKNPGPTAIAILTLGFGIGANTAIFSVINSVLLRSLPFPRASELVYVSSRSTMFDFPNLGLSLPDIADVRANTSVFASLATYQDAPKELTGGGRPERVESTEVSEDFFPALGIVPLQGRIVTSSDIQTGSHVAVLRNSLWHERFGGEPSAVGKKIMLDGQPYTVIGVVPDEPALDFATDSKIWTAFLPSPEQLADRGNHEYSVVARLKTDMRITQAENELATIGARLAVAYPNVDKEWSIHATPLKQFLLGDVRAPLVVLFCAVGFVLLIACANVSNFFLSRGWARRQEFAIRTAIGATRGALLRQLCVECALVALAGGVCAFLAASWTVDGLRAMLPPGIPRSEEIRVDGVVAWFTLGVSLLAATLSGLAPALLSTRQNLSGAIKESSGPGGVYGTVTSHNLLRQLLVMGEVAVAAVLLIGATLAVRSFDHLMRLDFGFRPDHVFVMRLDFPKFRFSNEVHTITFVQQILDSVRAIPGVRNAATGLVFPMSDEVTETSFQTQESVKDQKSPSLTALTNRVAPGFFDTFGIPLLAGRDFDSRDARGNPLVFVVNETLARKSFGSLDVLGKPIAFPLQSGQFMWGEIVGVVGDVRDAIPGSESKPQIYAPYYQAPRVMGVYLAVRTKSDPSALVSSVQERIWAVDKNQPITAVETLEMRIAEVNATAKAQSLLLGIFGGIGFLLAVVGIYGVMSYLVSLQTKELGIRMALGAERRQILRMVIFHGLKLTLSGVFAGIVCGLILTRFMSSLLIGISVTDPVTFAGVALLLIVVAVAACVPAARRATRVDPMVALRYE